MNIEKTATLLGQLKTILGVFDQLPPKSRELVEGTLKFNGLDVVLIARNVCKVKHSLESIPAGAFEPLVAISTEHLTPDAREALSQGNCDAWGVISYPNEYGAFLHVSPHTSPSPTAPQCLQEVYQWAQDRFLVWVKFDPDAGCIAGLPSYGEDDDELKASPEGIEPASSEH